MKNLLLAAFIFTFTNIAVAQQTVPNFIEKDKTYVGAIAMTGEIVFKVVDIDDKTGWILVKAQEYVFGEHNTAWLNIDHLVALREVSE